jgi:hypothetical protein
VQAMTRSLPPQCLLLLEDMNVSEEFCQWLAAQTSMPINSVDSHAAWHSIPDASLGESDLVMLITSGGGTFALLIENKIDAPAMPAQGERYSKRGNIEIQKGKWHWFSTCMVAPKLYLDKSDDATVYDVKKMVGSWTSLRAYYHKKEKVGIDPN